MKKKIAKKKILNKKATRKKVAKKNKLNVSKVSKKVTRRKSKVKPVANKPSTIRLEKTIKTRGNLKGALDNLTQAHNRLQENKPKIVTSTESREPETIVSRSISLNSKVLKQPVLIVSGEHSGDLLGGEIVQSLKKQGFESFVGTGGDVMEQAGVSLFEHIRTMNVVGFVEALKAWSRLKKLALRITKEVIEKQVSFAVLIDYPGFNLRLAEMLKEAGIPVIYLVSPQIWAWHYSRIKQIKKCVDLMLPLFPFEEEMYTKENIPAHAVGHPLVTRTPKALRKEEFLPSSPKFAKRVIALIPGSRRGEVSRLLPTMLESAKLLKQVEPKTRFLLACADPSLNMMIQELIQGYDDLAIEVYQDRTYRIMEASDALIIASGTATLEGAFFKKPMVLLYRVGLINLLIGSMVMRVRYVGIVNILGRKQTILELLQSEVTPKNIYNEINKIFTNEKYRKQMIDELTYVRSQMGSGNPGSKAVKYMLEFLSSRTK